MEVYNIPGNTLEVSSIPTVDNTLEVYISHFRKYAGGTYNIPNTRDSFAGNFDTCAGSFDRLTSDPVLATGGCIKTSDSFQQCNFGNCNPFALERKLREQIAEPTYLV